MVISAANSYLWAEETEDEEKVEGWHMKYLW